MRITTRELQRNALYVINNRYNDLAKLQEQLATGKRLQRPSDDPVDVANDLKLLTKQRELVQHKKNIEDGLSYMGVTETAMDSINTLLQKMRELSIQSATDTLSANERVYINKEVEQISRQLVSVMNTQFKGDYIFGGQQTKINPLEIRNSTAATVDDYTNLNMGYFNANGAPVGTTVQIFDGLSSKPLTNIIPGSFTLSVAGTNFSEMTDYTLDYEAGTITILNPALALDVTPGTPNYDISQVAMTFDSLDRGTDIYGQIVSNRGEILREIESGVTTPINISLDEMSKNRQTGDTLVTTMIRFGQSLVQNNQPAISNAIDSIDAVFSTVLSAQAKNGSRVNRLQTTLERNENQYTQTTSLQSELEDAEMADTMSKFMLTQNVYNAALQSAAKIIQPSLVNFL